jgi:hypothetical protein
MQEMPCTSLMLNYFEGMGRCAHVPPPPTHTHLHTCTHTCSETYRDKWFHHTELNRSFFLKLGIKLVRRRHVSDSKMVHHWLNSTRREQKMSCWNLFTYLDRQGMTFRCSWCLIIQAADCDTNHCLVVAKVKEGMAVSQQTMNGFHMERFILKELQSARCSV